VLGFRDALNKQKSRLSAPRPKVPESDKGGGIERFGQGVIPTSGGTKFDQLLRKNESKTLRITALEGTQQSLVSGPKSIFDDLFKQANGEEDGDTRPLDDSSL
jgi:hypothetical protein